VTEHVDDGHQVRTRGQHSLSRVPLETNQGGKRELLRYYFEIKREKLYKLFDKKQAGSDRNAFGRVGKFLALIIDLSQRTLISLIKGHW